MEKSIWGFLYVYCSYWQHLNILQNNEPQISHQNLLIPRITQFSPLISQIFTTITDLRTFLMFSMMQLGLGRKDIVMSRIQNQTIVEPTKTVVCSPAVLAAVTDVSLVRICQSPLMIVHSSSQTVEDCSGLTLDAAQIELCRRYRPLILKYARLSSHQTMADDVESFLWIVFLEAVQSYDTTGDVPFAGYVKSMMHYGHLRFFKQSTRCWRHEISYPAVSDDEDGTFTSMEQFADTATVESTVLHQSEEDSLRHTLWSALQRLTPDQQQLLHKIYVEGHSFTSIGHREHITPQAVQNRHKRALQRLKEYMMIAHSSSSKPMN